MSGGVASLRFRLQRKGARKQELDKRKKLVQQLRNLGVKVNKPYEMDIKQLEMLVNHHWKTIEAQKTVVSDEQMKTAESNGLTERDVIDRVDDLNWDMENAVEVKKTETKEQQRERRKRERMLMIQKLNEMECQNERIN